MKPVPKTRLDVVEGMPVTLAAKLEFSSSLELFRLAAEHWIQYNTLVNAAWKDIDEVVDWFIATEKYEQGIRWLYDNTPDQMLRLFAIKKLMDKQEEKSKQENTA